MKSLPAPLQAHLDEGTTTLAWCWRITRADGVVLGFTDHDRTLFFLGTSFEPDSGLIASEVRSGSDLSVDAQDAEGVLMSGRITETDIIDGRWDNAQVEAWRVNWADTAQRVLMRQGNVGQIRRGRMAFVAEVRSMAHELGQTVGRTFQAACDAALGDARCGVNLEAAGYKGTGAVITLLRDRAFLASGLGGFPDNLFSFGTVEWSSGPNAGRRTEVMIHEKAGSDVTITLLGEPVRAIAVEGPAAPAVDAGGEPAHIGVEDLVVAPQDGLGLAEHLFGQLDAFGHTLDPSCIRHEAWFRRTIKASMAARVAGRRRVAERSPSMRHPLFP